MHPQSLSRRNLIGSATLSAGAVWFLRPFASEALAQDQRASAAPNPATIESFPSQPSAMVRDIVGASHRDISKVEALLKSAPRLANAAYDWGFGDWETALGAASHTGRREIALLLLKHGARPDIFAYAMLGKVDAVKAMIEAQPGLQRTLGPHGIPLLAHAEAGGEENASTIEYLTSLGDAGVIYQDVPLPDGSRDQVLGEYSYGPAANQRLAIELRPRDQRLTIKGPPGNANNLFHQGDLVFHPAGAPEVHLTFKIDAEQGASLTITTPDPLIVARQIR